MGILTVTGQAGCRTEEVARITRKLLGFDFLPAARLDHLLTAEYGSSEAIPQRVWIDAVASLAGPLAQQKHLVVTGDGVHRLGQFYPGTLRVHLIASASVRAGALMIEKRLDRTAAREQLRELDARQKEILRQRLGRSTISPQSFDLLINEETFSSETMAAQICEAVRASALETRGLLSAATVSHVQFRVRLRLARHGLTPPGRVDHGHPRFGHPSEEIFANLLDFYRIAWEYEPRSFPLQFGPDGKTTEAFTPDFYLPEIGLFVELTTMKQSLVTRKNRKVKRLRELYPDVQIQVFYQKDFENLIFKYGLLERSA